MVLLEAGREDRKLTQRDLGRALGIDKGNVARLCQRMGRAGHAVQGRSAHDGRARIVSLTEGGERLAQAVDASSRDRFQRLMEAVPPEYRARVLSSLAVLNQAIATGEKPPR